jgi:small subunit ribosomal protein S17
MSEPDGSGASAPAASAGAVKGPKLIEGTVTSAKMQKTRSVEVTRLEKHPKYGKFLRRRTTFKVHDEREESKEGDRVIIAETRPLSKTKRWRLVKVVARPAAGLLVVVPGGEDSAALAATEGEAPEGQGGAS